MKIKRIKFQNYTVFEDQQMEFSPGINVIIGENGTGKTHLMSNTTNIRIYNIICCLCGLIGFFFCFVVESGDPHIPGYYLLPLSFALFHIACVQLFS